MSHGVRSAGTAVRAGNLPGRWTDVDDVAVERAVAGQHAGLRLLPGEIREAVRRLAAAGVGLSESARRIGVSSRTVSRYRRALREERD